MWHSRTSLHTEIQQQVFGLYLAELFVIGIFRIYFLSHPPI